MKFDNTTNDTKNRLQMHASVKGKKERKEENSYYIKIKKGTMQCCIEFNFRNLVNVVYDGDQRNFETLIKIDLHMKGCGGLTVR